MNCLWIFTKEHVGKGLQELMNRPFQYINCSFSIIFNKSKIVFFVLQIKQIINSDLNTLRLPHQNLILQRFAQMQKFIEKYKK